jgi:hypothetical protein
VEKPEGKDHYEDLGVDGILLKLILKKSDGWEWIDQVQDTSSGLLWTRQWTFGLHKTRVNAWIAENY